MKAIASWSGGKDSCLACYKAIKEGFEITNKKLSKEELIKEIENYDALIVRGATKVTKEVVEAGSKNLKIIGIMKNFHTHRLKYEIEPVMFQISSDAPYSYINIKLP